RKDTLYGGEGYSIFGGGDLASKLDAAIERFPRYASFEASRVEEPTARGFVPPPLSRHIAEGSFFVADDRTICQVIGGESASVVYGGRTLRAGDTLTAKRLSALIHLRDLARRVLESQNEGWPESDRNDARRELNWAYDRFHGQYGPINKTTFG